MTKVYKWRKGSRFNADSQKIGEELLSLKNPTTKEIVEFAKDKNTELHNCFEWNTGKAAYKAWLLTAQKVARNIVYIVVETTAKEKIEPIEIRLVEHVRYKEEGHYTPTEKALKRIDFTEQIFNRIKTSLVSACNTLNSYSIYSEKFSKYSKKIKRIITELEKELKNLDKSDSM